MSSSEDEPIIEDEHVKVSKKRKNTNVATSSHILKPKKRLKKTVLEEAKSSIDVHELMFAINENNDDFLFILCLSGKLVSEESSKKEMRSAYRKLSKMIHPDRHKNSKESTTAFQALATAFETLTNPDAGAPEFRGKDKRVQRDNDGCFLTKINCPRCNSPWQRDLLGLEKPSFNFFMMGTKQYICGLCCMKFGALTGIHFTPCCNKQFTYNAETYDQKVECASLIGEKKTKKQKTCKKNFGFHRYKVSETREKEIRKEVKKEAERDRKARASSKRRKARLDRRSPNQKLTSAAEETLFVIGLNSCCPRCGWEILVKERSRHTEMAKAHLNGCDDEAKILAYQAGKKRKQEEEEARKAQEALEAEMLALKSWETNGRQIGQLWMLPLSQLQSLCEMNNLKKKGDSPTLIKRLFKHLKKSQALAITDGSEYKKDGEKKVYDFCSIQHVDQEDLPENLHSLELDELRGVCAGYNIPYRNADMKADLILKLEKKRFKGKLMIKG